MLLKLQVYQAFNKKILTQINDQLITILIPTNFQQKIICGDWIAVEQKQEQFFLKQLLERKNYLIRPKVANIDLILIIYPLNGSDNFDDLLWWILTYESINFDVKVVFSKSDLLSEKDRINKIKTISNLISDLKVEAFDYHNPNDWSNLKAIIENHLIVLSGYSGAGKSTFLNWLNPHWQILTQALNSKNLGKHTTTTAKIYQIDKIKIIDAPGFNNLNLKLVKQDIASGWHLFHDLKCQCKFNDCLHNNPNVDCAIINAVAAKKINQTIYQIYLNFLNKN
ncbi:Small ribosomal subunit biogenesis GTPase RsgA/EngC [[Mycoplasma] cavipharyngis]|uniref:ribosome small subunit-dependent GTPase A n=1 Tax=[Mycoplasma] cavipharyngis TaxID=92757 RepID=UPI003704159D